MNRLLTWFYLRVFSVRETERRLRRAGLSQSEAKRLIADARNG